MVYDNLHITAIAMFQEVSNMAPTQIANSDDCFPTPQLISMNIYLHPRKLNGWNLKITQTKRRIIFHPPPFLGSIDVIHPKTE